jgi:hypothetical protein
MNGINENEYNALIDALKNITDVISVLTIKQNLQEEEINKLKNENLLLEENTKNLKNSIEKIKLNGLLLHNAELNTEQDNISIDHKEIQKNNNYVSKNNSVTNISDEVLSDINKENNIDFTEATTIRETEIERLRKNKAIQIVDKLIQKKKELVNKENIQIDKNNGDNVNNVKNFDNGEPDNMDKDEEIQKQNIILKRKNKIMRRF